MDNSATKTQQDGNNQPAVQPAPVQNVASFSSVDANVDNKVPQPVVVNRGGIQVNLSTPQPNDTGVSQDDSSSIQPAPQQNTPIISQNESMTPSPEPSAQAAPVVQVEEKPQESQPMPQPVSAPRSKEQEPVPAPFPDVAKMSEAEIIDEEKEVEKELEALVEKSPDTEKPDIPKDVQAIGVKHAGADIPHPVAPSGSVVLPMTFDEANNNYNKKQWKNSISWFAGLIIYHWKKIKAATPIIKKKED